MAWRRFTTLLRQRTDDINDGARKIVSLGVGGCIGCLFCDWFYEIHGMQPSEERRELIVAARELIKKERKVKRQEQWSTLLKRMGWQQEY